MLPWNRSIQEGFPTKPAAFFIRLFYLIEKMISSCVRGRVGAESFEERHSLLPSLKDDNHDSRLFGRLSPGRKNNKVFL